MPLEPYTIKCSLCGQIVNHQWGKRGRIPERHKDCTRVEGLFVWLETNLSDITPTPEKKKEIRSRLWYLANLLNSDKK